MVTDLDFADDLVLLANTTQQAQKLLHGLAKLVGLSMNAEKTKFMTVNLNNEESSIHALNGFPIEHVSDFKYLGSYIADSRKDFNTRKGIAWSVLSNYKKTGLQAYQKT